VDVFTGKVGFVGETEWCKRMQKVQTHIKVKNIWFETVFTLRQGRSLCHQILNDLGVMDYYFCFSFHSFLSIKN